MIEVRGWPRWLREEVRLHPSCQGFGIERKDEGTDSGDEVFHVREGTETDASDRLRDCLDNVAHADRLLLTYGRDRDGTVHREERILLCALSVATPDWLRTPSPVHSPKEVSDTLTTSAPADCPPSPRPGTPPSFEEEGAQPSPCTRPLDPDPLPADPDPPRPLDPDPPSDPDPPLDPNPLPADPDPLSADPDPLRADPDPLRADPDPSRPLDPDPPLPADADPLRAVPDPPLPADPDHSEAVAELPSPPNPIASPALPTLLDPRSRTPEEVPSSPTEDESIFSFVRPASPPRTTRVMHDDAVVYELCGLLPPDLLNALSTQRAFVPSVGGQRVYLSKYGDKVRAGIYVLAPEPVAAGVYVAVEKTDPNRLVTRRGDVARRHRQRRTEYERR